MLINRKDIFRIDPREQPLPRRIIIICQLGVSESFGNQVSFSLPKIRESVDSLQIPYILLLIASPYTDYIGKVCLFITNVRKLLVLVCTSNACTDSTAVIASKADGYHTNMITNGFEMRTKPMTSQTILM